MNSHFHADTMFGWRTQAYVQFCKWHAEGKVFGYSPGQSKGIEVLAEALGYAGPEACKAKMNEADVEIIKALIGPNGWAIYKALLIRRGKK